MVKFQHQGFRVVLSGGLGLLVFAASAGAADRTISPPAISRNYTEIRAFMLDLATRFPANVESFDLGRNNAGEVIQGLKIGSGPVKNLVVAAHHGNEYGSVEVAKGFAAAIAAAPIPGQTLFVIPVLNIPGYNVRQRREPIGMRSFDANRDYPGPCGSDGPFNLKSTEALADFVGREKIVTIATLHTNYPAVVYPWGLSAHGHDLETEYEQLFKDIVASATVESRYRTGNSTVIMYPADGTFEDWSFWQHGTWSILFELGHSHNPSQTAVDEMVRVNTPGLIRMFEQAPRQVAERHAFTGVCDASMKALDRRDE